MTVAQLKGFAQHKGLEPEGKALKGDWIRMISVSNSNGRLPGQLADQFNRSQEHFEATSEEVKPSKKSRTK